MESIQNEKVNMEKKENEIIDEVKKIISSISKEFKEKELEIGQALAEGTKELREQQKQDSIIMPCPVCKQGNLSIRYSKKIRRYFAACDRYPDCKTTHSLPPNALIKTTGKISENNLPVLVAIRKGKRPWEFEFNPNYKKEQANYSEQK